MIYQFENYTLDTGRYELLKDGEPQRMEPQVFDVLKCLVENHDQLVSKDDLLDRVWGDRFISEAALNSRLMAARRAVGDSGKEQRLIRTMHGRGFRFVGVVRVEGEQQPGAPVAGPAAASEVGASRLNQQIKFCTAPDGVRIAYATVGSGPPLVKAPNWLTHIEYEWESPVWRHWWEDLAQDNTVIRFDQRGSGLSDWEVEDMSLEAWISDLEAVVDAAGVPRFSLLGISQGGAVAAEYAIRHPEKVNRLIVYGAFVKGAVARGESIEEREAILTLMRQGWGRNNPAYRQMFTSQFMPEAMSWFNELQRVSTSGDNAARIQRTGSGIDLMDRLPLVSVPTLVMHARGDERVRFDQGRLFASLIPNARLVALESRNHLIRSDEPAWARLIAEVRSFLHEETATEDPHTPTATAS